jgi:hypothetical protein
MEGVLPLALLLGASGSVLYLSRKSRHNRGVREGFQEKQLVNPVLQATFESALGQDGVEHVDYIKQGAAKYNPIMNLIPDVLNNPLVPVDPTSKDIQNINSKLQDALGAVSSRSTGGPVHTLSKTNTSMYLVNPASNNTTLRKIKYCQTKSSISEDQFKEKEFVENECGICHSNGVTSDGIKQLGGLFIDKDVIENTKIQAANAGKRPVYTPSAGSCENGFFSTNYDEARRINNRMKCDREQTFTDTCMQAFQSGKFVYVGEKDIDYTLNFPKLYLVGQGACVVSVNNIQVFPLPPTDAFQLSNSPQEVQLGAINEGSQIIVQIAPSVPSQTPFVGGYLEGNTQTGLFRIDIARLADAEIYSGKKPRIVGRFQIDSGSFAKLMSPVPNQTVSGFLLYDVFTFISFLDESFFTKDSVSTPFIRNPSSATLLENSPCYKKGQEPGKYSTECLQTLFTGAGCTESGTAYPSNATKTADLQRRPDGSFKDITEIANDVYMMSQRTYTGKNESGVDLSIADWDDISKKCTGKEVSNPCTYDNLESGPLSPNCITYLYKNEGSIDKSIGSTYTGSSSQASLSLTGDLNQFCTPNGTASPSNPEAMALAQQQGGLKAVKNFYDSIHKKANNNSLPDDERKDAIKQCYGTTLAEQNAKVISKETERYKQYFCTPAKFADSLIGDGSFKSGGPIQSIQVLSNWKWSFTLTITKKSGPTSWSSVLWATQTGNGSWNTAGARCPCLIIAPNSSTLYLTMVNNQGKEVAVATDRELELNVSYLIEAEFKYGYMGQGELSLTYGKTPQTMKRAAAASLPTSKGGASVYVGSSWAPAFTGTLTNVSYCTNDTVIETPLDNPSARTKNPGSRKNYSISPLIVATFRKQAVELGPYGMQPWGTWFTEGFPIPTTAKWIWNTPFGSTGGIAADNFNSTFRMVVFIKMFINTSNDTISAVLWVGVDNVGRIVVNDETLATNVPQKQSFNITLPPGENLISIGVTNAGGPAGLLVDCKDISGKVLFVSDNTWKNQ